jgi:dTDP-4-dehydrorhamnose reductase
MRILVVGASGQLGSDFVRAASSLEPVAPGRDVLDLGRPEDMVSVLEDVRPEVVVNCAAYNDTAAAESDAVQAFQVNAYGPERLAGAAAVVGAR